MNTLNTLYFPGTTIHAVSQYPLFLLFPGIHLLSAAESSIHGDKPQAIDSFIETGFCQVKCPVPLGKDLERFIHLVNDIKNRTDDYSSQLSGLTLAAMSDPAGKNECSSQEIVSSLLSAGSLAGENKEDEAKLKLWQARLVLAIGEMLDYKEDEIALQLAMIHAEERELFKRLQGKGDDSEQNTPLTELTLIQDNISPPGQTNTIKRLQSWKQLYGREGISACDILLTTSRDSAELILEACEKNSDRRTIQQTQQIQMTLPATIGLKTEHVLTAVDNFRENSVKLIDTFTEILLQLKHRKDPKEPAFPAPEFSSFNKSWEEHLESQFPAEQFGRIPLTICSFTNNSCSSLLNPDQQAGSEVNCLMAVMEPTLPVI